MSDIEIDDPVLNVEEVEDPEDPDIVGEDGTDIEDGDEESDPEDVEEPGEEDGMGEASQDDDDEEEEEENGMIGGAATDGMVADLPTMEASGGTLADLDEDILGDRNKKIVHHDNILFLHPGSQYRNMDEIYASSVVTRNENNIIIDALHTAVPIMTKYEKARILGMRTKQLNKSKTVKPYVHVDRVTMDNGIIADMELKQKKLPFIIERPMPGGGVEYWNVKDLEVI
jgi:DNA-directed RNA polymerase subunit K/omega